MAQNVEIKARIANPASLRARIVGLGALLADTQEQTDRYYELNGSERLKLRTIDNTRAELIRYRRPEIGSVRRSDYEIAPAHDVAAAKCLVPKQEPLVIVRKRREIHLLENVRFHLDEVEGLGTFLELEAVVDAEHDEAVCRRQIERITLTLQLDPQDFIRASYAEMARERAVGKLRK